MLTAKFVRTQPEIVAAMLKKRHLNLKTLTELSLEEFIEIETRRLNLLQEVEKLQADRNHAAKENAAKKLRGEAIAHTTLKALAADIQKKEAILTEYNHKIKLFLFSLPNLLAEEVPLGADETANKVVKVEGKPPTFAFTPRAHDELTFAGGSIDKERASKLAAARFAILTGALAKLARALMQLFMDENAKHGYQEIIPPTLVNQASMTGTAQLPKFAADVFRLGGDFTNLYLISTSEIPLVNYHANEILPNNALPLYYTATTSCYRSEAGAAGRDTRGLIRLHEFHKTELVQIVHPATSDHHHKKLVTHSEHLLKLLGLPYRIVLLCGGDTGFAAAKCYDLEVWFPAQKAYREIASCSNCYDFQAHRAKIRYRDPHNGIQPVHTLNGSALPIERTLGAILENFQTASGNVALPPVLHRYMGQKTLFSQKSS